MNWKRTARWSWFALPFLLLALWPGVAAAQSGVGDANAVLYEVTENLKLKPLASGRRIATSALMGTVNAGTSICPFDLAAFLGVTACSLNAMASDNVNLATGKGPFQGTFEVVINTPDTNPVDGPELVIMRGSFRGTIDFSLAILGPPDHRLPIGFLSNGRWSAKGVAGGPLQGVRARGTLTGTFRLPFDGPIAVPVPPGCADDFDLSDCTGTILSALYLGAGFVPVPAQANELSLGVPTVRMEINFVDN